MRVTELPRRLRRRMLGGSLELVRLQSSDKRSWALFPHALQRVGDFFSKYSAEGNSTLTCSNISNLFINHPQRLGFWVFISPSVGTVGHLLAWHETNEAIGLRWTFVLQVEIDAPLPKPFRMKVMSALAEFGRENDSKYIEMLTPLPEKVWLPYGFTLHRKVMRRSL